MTDNESDKAIEAAQDAARSASNKPVKRRQSNGIRACLNTGKLPSGRSFKRDIKRIEQYRRQLVEQYGGPDKIRPDVAVIIENAITSAYVSLLCQSYLKKAGIFRRDSLNRGDLELHSVLQRGFSTFSALVTRQLEAAARLSQMKTAPDDGSSVLGQYLALRAKETPGGTVYEAPAGPAASRAGLGEANAGGLGQGDGPGAVSPPEGDLVADARPAGPVYAGDKSGEGAAGGEVTHGAK